MNSTDLTDNDKAAGFEVSEVTPGVQGVLRRFGDSDRVVKIVDPAGQVQYRHERYGNWAFERQDDPSKWRPAFDDFAVNPAQAVKLAEPRVTQDAVVKIVPRKAP